MDFDLSLIDKVGSTNKAPARASKFAPRAKARPQQKPEVEKPPEPAISVPADVQSAQESREPENNGEGPLPGSKDTSQRIQQRTDADELGNEPSAVPQKEVTQPAAPRESAAEEPSPQAASPPVLPAAAGPAAQPAVSPPPERGDPQPDPGEQRELAVVPVAADGEIVAAEPSPKRRKVATGKRSNTKGGKKVLSVQEQASVVLHPETDSIKKYVERAKAQERLRHAEKQKKREADAEDEEQEEQLALQAPPETSLTLAPQLELVDGKLVPKQQSLMVQAQALPSYRRVTEYNSIVNNASHTNRMQSERWTADETEAFFSAVKCFGPNFELLSKLFPGRPRRALANKWRRENKANPERIDETFAGGGSLAGLQKVVEALTNTETTADGDVGDLGMDAAQLFGVRGGPPGQEGSDEEEAKPPPKKPAAKRRRMRAKAKAAADSAEASEATPAPDSAEAGDNGNEAAAGPPGGSFRKEGSKRKPQKKASAAASAEDGGQVAAARGATKKRVLMARVARGKQAKKRKVKAASDGEASTDDAESDFEPPARGRPVAQPSRTTRSTQVGSAAEPVEAQVS